GCIDSKVRRGRMRSTSRATSRFSTRRSIKCSRTGPPAWMRTRDEMSADYVMVGGFLGAGKTTALLRLAEHFTSQGRRVGLITNDQSQGLVDTSIVSASGYPVEEITGGCFCCRFKSLTDAADRLTRDARPDVFLAEPVWSLTDLACPR